MGQNRRNYRRNTYEENRRAYLGRNRDEYVYGNAVRKISPQEEWEQTPAKKVNPGVRKNREKARHMSAGYVMFLAVALCAAAFILVNYIQLQSELTTLTKTVADKESELNILKLSNDEDYNRIISSINLEDIKRVAIGELGMGYAKEGQIVEYENEEGDYMRRVTESNK
ncbi:cell division protein FtsL [Acetatifactor aquisgranensis]|uniref:cell division protein FtsL n=1 Tax=Acetatifactor aquisgranensis TaxID=2941233 RepID=UPI00204238FE|nr:cell division protein FtsL [Acetatifactor aquisgranensis]